MFFLRIGGSLLWICSSELTLQTSTCGSANLISSPLLHNCPPSVYRIWVHGDVIVVYPKLYSIYFRGALIVSNPASPNVRACLSEALFIGDCLISDLGGGV